MADVSKDPAFIAKTTALGIVPTARGPKEFAAFIKNEIETNTALLNDAGYKPERWQLELKDIATYIQDGSEHDKATDTGRT